MAGIFIQRKRKSDLAMVSAWARLAVFVLAPLANQAKQDRQNYMLGLKAQEIQARTAVSALRVQVLHDELVLRDQKIEKQELELQLLRRKVALLGGTPETFAPASDYGESEQPVRYTGRR